MEVIAKSRFIHQTPRKLRLVASQLRGLKAEAAVDLLESLNKKAARLILLTLKQGMGNAVNNFQLAKSSLVIKAIEVNEGPRYKRMDKSHRFFRWGTIKKRLSHLRIVLEGKEEKKPAKVKKRRKTAVAKTGANKGGKRGAKS